MKTFFTTTILFFTLLFLSEQSHAQGPFVSTDADDYSPGSTAYISGFFFNHSDTVTLRVLRVDIPVDSTKPPYQPWQVVADSNGDFNTSWYVDGGELGAVLQLTAIDNNGGYDIVYYFTDAMTVGAFASRRSGMWSDTLWLKALAGTISVSNGSTAVTGVSTHFNDMTGLGVTAGDSIIIQSTGAVIGK